MSSSISSASRCGNSSTPECSRKHLKPNTPSSCSGRRSALLPGTAPPQNPTSTNAWSSATSRLSLRPSTVVVGGMEFSGMSMMVVTPPAAAARVADAKPSHSVRPGSLTWTCVSTRPGIAFRRRRARYFGAGEAVAERLDRDDLPPRTPTSRAAMPAVVRMRRPRMTRSKARRQVLQTWPVSLVPVASAGGRRWPVPGRCSFLIVQAAVPLRLYICLPWPPARSAGRPAGIRNPAAVRASAWCGRRRPTPAPRRQPRRGPRPWASCPAGSVRRGCLRR